MTERVTSQTRSEVIYFDPRNNIVTAGERTTEFDRNRTKTAKVSGHPEALKSHRSFALNDLQTKILKGEDYLGLPSQSTSFHFQAVIEHFSVKDNELLLLQVADTFHWRIAAENETAAESRLDLSEFFRVGQPL